ncbi:vWA domain-containing protein [Glycomyces tritici]|uniref:VWA domain-containing protein n=1 Tax=Glycomyces tritici TaxID=2665176 RepID=A0ABT7YY06_9ACTN|nr:vWA domain-containing protein [Glycomyces tritici]MDN3243531.1 VWA domain-containing protein [Glycomyces tritici]
MVFGTTHKVRSHRLGRRRKKGGNRMVVAPWIVITLVCVVIASGLTWGFVALLRSGCDGPIYRVSVAAAPSLAGSLQDAAQAWEATSPEASTGQCIGAEIREVPAAEASRAISGDWDVKTLGKRPIAWVPDSQAWASWLASNETTAGYVTSDPLVLGQAASVLAVPASKAAELGWETAPPTWSEVLTAAQDGTITLAAANPRTSTEGLVAMLNATGDGSGTFSAETMDTWKAAIGATALADGAGEHLAAYIDAPDPSRVVTALDYQVEDFNLDNAPADPLVAVTPSDSRVSAVATYLVLGGGWVSDSDAAIAEAFGDYLKGEVGSGGFEDSELAPVDDPEAALAQTTPEVVGEAVRTWQVGREDLHVLFLVDRSSTTDEETVAYDGKDLTAGDAAAQTAIATVQAMESTYRVGVWEYGVGAGEDEPYREVSGLTELSADGRGNLETDLYDVSENHYDGGSPLYDTLVAASEYMNGQAADGALPVIVVLTNASKDEVSEGSAEATAEQLAGPAVVYTVGFGQIDPVNLTTLAEATGGAYIDAPDEGDLLASIGG